MNKACKLTTCRKKKKDGIHENEKETKYLSIPMIQQSCPSLIIGNRSGKGDFPVPNALDTCSMVGRERGF